MRLHGSLIIFFLASSLSNTLLASEIPPFLKICHRSDPHLSECIQESIKLLKPYLKDGIPALRIPACEPLRLDEIKIDQTSGPIYVHAKYSNISIFGGTNIVPKTIKLDLDKNRMKLKLYIPWLDMIVRYNLNGRIMLVPITGNGVGHGNFTDIDVVITLQMERYQNQKTGETHQRVNDIYVDFEIGHVNVELDNLFDGDDTLSGALNLFLNDNWRTIVAEIRPKLEETIGELIKDFANEIFSEFSENVLLPP